MTEERIGQEFYDSSGYFEGVDDHLGKLDTPFQRYRIAKVFQIHTPLATDRVLDMGCGWGTFGFALAQQTGEIVGLDFSQKSIEICSRRLGEEPHANLSFVQADAGASGLGADSFDVVIAADLFEHLYPDDSERVAKEAFRVLKPGGRFSTWTPHRGHFLEALKNRDILIKRDVSHVDYKSIARMRGLLTDAGVEIEKAYYAESHLPVLNVAERALQGFLPFMRRRVAVLGRKPAE